MKGIMGWILFAIGLMILIEGAIKHYGNDMPWWELLLAFGILAFGLDWIIEDKIDLAKEELQREAEHHG